MYNTSPCITFMCMHVKNNGVNNKNQHFKNCNSVSRKSLLSKDID